MYLIKIFIRMTMSPNVHDVNFYSGSSATNESLSTFPLSTKRFQQSLNGSLSENRNSAQSVTSGLKPNKSISLNGNLNDMLTTFDQAFIISDATSRDIPITFASEGFYKMTGFTHQEIIGNNCRFLQGPETDQTELYRLRLAIEAGKTYCGRLLNYKKDGSTFWNLLTICPIRDEHDKIVKYIGMQVEVTKYTEGTLSCAKRPNELPVSLISYDARQKVEAESYADEILRDLNSVKSAQDHEDQVQPIAETSVQRNPRKSFTLLNQILTPKQSLSVPKNGSHLPGINPSSIEEEGEEYFVNTRERNMRRGIDLATTLERIQKSFLITDPRLPENPIIFVSDEFLELTEYTREEVLGQNCRFLQGEETNPSTVLEIQNAIRKRENVTVQILNYKKSGKKFWNLFHLQIVKDNKGELEYFIGIQLDVTKHIHKESERVSENTMKEEKDLINEAANDITYAVKEFPDPTFSPSKLWESHRKIITPKPHSSNSDNWKAVSETRLEDGELGLNHFRPIKPLGTGDTGSVYLAELKGTGKLFAIKSMDKEVMINTNKVQRVRTEREILSLLDHPFLPTLFASFETRTHVYLVTEFCPGRELYMVVKQQMNQRLGEDLVRFYSAEVLLALEYLHCKGIIYRDLKPENVLLNESGHIILTDFDLSLLVPTSSTLYQSTLHRLHDPKMTEKQRKKVMKEEEKLKKKEEKRLKKEQRRKEREEITFPHSKNDPSPAKNVVKVKKGSKNVLHFSVQPSQFTNSFVGTEEYIAPEIINGIKHGVHVDWWSFGIFLYELLYGKTPFRGETRNQTFNNIRFKELTFPLTPPVSNDAKDLIKRLLNRSPEKRLGGINGAGEVKRHPFFRSTQWSLLRSRPPPKLNYIEENKKDEDEFSNWDDVLGQKKEDKV
uniref:non-specific serine/threonine protein kinase n=1 Tax=Spirogyra varians TaxID=332125 RepID=A0A2D1CSK3_9VIRI|nr:phototropin [Spirogyra varians]